MMNTLFCSHGTLAHFFETVPISRKRFRCAIGLRQFRKSYIAYTVLHMHSQGKACSDGPSSRVCKTYVLHSHSDSTKKQWNTYHSRATLLFISTAPTCFVNIGCTLMWYWITRPGYANFQCLRYNSFSVGVFPGPPRRHVPIQSVHSERTNILFMCSWVR